MARAWEGKSLEVRLGAIRNDIGLVEMELSAETEADPFPVTPAPKVFRLVADQLRLKRVLAVPAVEAGGGKALATVTFHNQDDQEAERIVAGPWPGEAGDEDRATSKAATNALKALYMAFFLIETVQPADFGPAVTGKQLHDAIYPASYAAGLTGDQLDAFIRDNLRGLEKLERVEFYPRNRVVELLDALRELREADKAAAGNDAAEELSA